jgi:hypothetical protein
VATLSLSGIFAPNQTTLRVDDGECGFGPCLRRDSPNCGTSDSASWKVAAQVPPRQTLRTQRASLGCQLTRSYRPSSRGVEETSRARSVTDLMRLGTALGLRFDIPALSEKYPSARDARLPRL